MKKIFDIETSGLNSMEDRVICISSINYPVRDAGSSISCEDEKELLELFWTIVDEGDQLIGYNSDDFDIPFLIKRSIINKVRIKKVTCLDLRKVANSFFTSYNKFEKGKLSDWAKILNFEVKTENGEHMIEYWKNRDFDKIKAHCIEDVSLTLELYKRLEECNLI